MLNIGPVSPVVATTPTQPPFSDASSPPPLLRNAAGGLALATCEEQHQEVRLGQKGEAPPLVGEVPLDAAGRRHLMASVVCLQYVVVSSKKILFYNNEQDKEQSIPYMVLDIE